MNATVFGQPLTHRQKLIWAEHVLAPEVPSNNNLVCFQFQERLDPARFVAAFARVVENTDVLRTVIRMQGDEPRQHVEQSIDGVCEIVDLTATADPMSAFAAWRNARCAKPFDLEHRLFDAALVMFEESCIWYFCQHHLICDAWSFALIFDRTAKVYADETVDLELARYAKYVSHEAQYRASDACVASATFWDEREPVQQLQPYGLPVTNKSAAIFRRKIDLGPERSTKIRELAQVEGFASMTPSLSISLVFTTAVFAYLHRVSGMEKIGIGSPVANRRSRWARGMPGLFMEVCALQASVDAGESFFALHQKTLNDAAAALPHARCSVGNPLHGKRFDVMLNFHNAKFPEFCGVPVAAEISNALLAHASNGDDPADRAIGRAGETLTFQVLDFGDTGSFELYFDFNRDVFTDAVADAAADHFVNLLDAFVDDPGMAIDAAALVPELEGAPSDSSPEQPNTPLDVVAEFQQQARRNPGRTALVAGDETLTYGELDERVAAVGRVLASSGVSRGDRIAVCLPRGSDLVAVLLGVMHAGCTYVPLDPNHPHERNAAILASVEPSLLIIGRETSAEGMTTDADAFVLQPGWHSLEGDTIATGERSRLAYVIFTSGSTGQPKGVEISHASLANFMGSMSAEPGMSEDDVLLAVTTVSFDIAALELFLPLATGAMLVIADETTCVDPQQLEVSLRDHSVTVMQATPATWQMLIDNGWSGAPDLKILCGGEALPRGLADAMLARADAVWNMYGPTETTIWSSTAKVAPSPQPIVLGNPIDRTYFRVLTSEGQLAPRGAPGELYIGGAGLADGYWRNPGLTAERFVSDPLDGSALLYRTGDRVRLNFDNDVEFLGRTDFQVKIRGFRIETAEIEAALTADPDVTDAVVIARGESTSERRLVAYVVAALGLEIEPAALARRLSTQLPRYMIPSHWSQLNALPRTANGKLDRSRLPEPEHTTIGVTTPSPADDLEVELASLWRETVGNLRIGRDDDFFELGGNSLSAVAMLAAVAERFDVDIPFGQFFDHPTIVGLAGLVRGLAGPLESAPAVLLNNDVDERPLFCIGGVHLYQDLARSLNDQVPVYGVYVKEEQKWMAAVGNNRDSGFPTAEVVASQYIDLIRERQPTGPYRLAGLSYGGILAFEIAHQLIASGNDVDALVLLDVRLNRAMAKANGWLDYVRFLLRALRQRRDRIKSLRDADIDRLLVDEVNRYENRITPYPGSALLCRARDQAAGSLEKDRSLGWAPVVGDGLELADCPGDHMGIIREGNAATTAEAISRYLDAAAA